MRTPRNTFQKVLDDRGARVRGLWNRNGTYYAQVRLGDHRTPVKVKLHADTLPQAVVALQDLRKQKRDGQLGVAKVKGVPSLTVCIDSYVSERERLKDKRPATLKREQSGLKLWKQFAGERIVSRLLPRDAYEFARWRKGQEVSGRAIDLDVIALRHVLNQAVRDGWLFKNPLPEWKPLADRPKRVRLVPPAEIDLLCRKSLEVLPLTGRMFADFLRVLQYSGCREAEARRLRWTDADWKRRQLTIGADGLAKNGLPRVLPMNKKLLTHLKAMHKRRDKDSQLLFPSPRGGGIVTSFKVALAKAMKACGIEDFGFHHLRHYFISHCVMSGVDFKTLATWVGHQDGGVLIGKVYAHLSDEHGRRQAKRVRV